MILCLAISVEHQLVIDKQTGRHTMMACAYTVLAWRCAVKTVHCATVVPWYHPTLHFTTTWALSPSCPPPPVGGFRLVCAGSGGMLHGFVDDVIFADNWPDKGKASRVYIQRNSVEVSLQAKSDVLLTSFN